MWRRATDQGTQLEDSICVKARGIRNASLQLRKITNPDSIGFAFCGDRVVGFMIYRVYHSRFLRKTPNSNRTIAPQQEQGRRTNSHRNNNNRTSPTTSPAPRRRTRLEAPFSPSAVANRVDYAIRGANGREENHECPLGTGTYLLCRPK